jgi:hypothetical protein
MIVASFGHYLAQTVQDHGAPTCARQEIPAKLDYYADR